MSVHKRAPTIARTSTCPFSQFPVCSEAEADKATLDYSRWEITTGVLSSNRMNSAVAQQTTAQPNVSDPGRWVTEQVYATIHSISRQTLANWTHQDRQWGRDRALPGHPRCRRVGRAGR